MMSSARTPAWTRYPAPANFHGLACTLVRAAALLVGEDMAAEE